MNFSIINVCTSERTTAKIIAPANARLSFKITTTFSLLFLFTLLYAHQVKAQYTGGEGSGYAMAELSLVTNLQQSQIEQALTVSPNPTQPGSSIFIHDNAQITRVSLKNMQGKMVATLAPKDQSNQLTIPNKIQSGLYLLVFHKNGKEQNIKLLIK